MFYLFVPVGNVYISEYANQRIRKVTVSSGIITTIAGIGSGTYSGDGGQATAAEINRPAGVTLDVLGISHDHANVIITKTLILLYLQGNVYIPDYDNHRVRKVTVATGIITTIAGTGTGSFSGDGGDATSATLNYPTGVAVDTTGSSII